MWLNFFGLASFQVHVKLLLPGGCSGPGGIQEVAVEEHPSLHKHRARGSRCGSRAWESLDAFARS